jgi:glycosyltransferase involved in cell wall biosynthesis
MRVLHVISAIDPVRGGPIVALLGMAEAQQAAGIQVRVAATWIEGESPAAAEALRKLGIEVAHIGPCHTPLRRHPQIVPVLEGQIASSDVVDIHAIYEEIQHQAARLARRHGVPYIVRPEGMLTPWSLAQSRMKKKLYMMWRLRNDLNRAAALAFTSQAECDATAPLGLTPKSIVEPLGVDLREFENLPPRGMFRDRYPKLAGKRIVLFLGRVHPGKGLELLIPAFAKVEAPDAMLVIVGPDSENFQATAESLVREYKIENRVVFTGMLRGPDRIAALADADLFALPSFHENFGIAVIEALAAGVPVIISNEVNVWKEIADAQVGGVVPTKVDPLAAELNRWLSDDSLRAAAARRARPFVEEHYNWSRIARRWMEHYTVLTAGAPDGLTPSPR